MTARRITLRVRIVAVAVTGLLGLLGALGAGVSREPQFVATAYVVLRPTLGVNPFAGPSSSETFLGLQTDGIIALSRSSGVQGAAVRAAGPEAGLSSVTMSPVGGGVLRVDSVAATSSGATTAADVVAASSVAALGKVYVPPTADPAAFVSAIARVENARPPATPSNTGPAVLAVLGLVAGVLIGVLVDRAADVMSQEHSA